MTFELYWAGCGCPEEAMVVMAVVRTLDIRMEVGMQCAFQIAFKNFFYHYRLPDFQ